MGTSERGNSNKRIEEMGKQQSESSIRLPGMGRSASPIFLIFTALLLTMVTTTAVAQDVRYSWLEISYMLQDISASGSQPAPDFADPSQIVVVNAQDGDGIDLAAHDCPRSLILRAGATIAAPPPRRNWPAIGWRVIDPSSGD